MVFIERHTSRCTDFATPLKCIRYLQLLLKVPKPQFCFYIHIRSYFTYFTLIHIVTHWCAILPICYTASRFICGYILFYKITLQLDAVHLYNICVLRTEANLEPSPIYRVLPKFRKTIKFKLCCKIKFDSFSIEMFAP